MDAEAKAHLSSVDCFGVQVGVGNLVAQTCVASPDDQLGCVPCCCRLLDHFTRREL